MARPKKPSPQHRWVTTLAEFDKDGNLLREEGYWYLGPWALAVAMSQLDFNAFRFYGTGTESGSTALELQDTNHTLTVSGNTAFQLRVRIDEVGGADGSTMDDFQLQYSKNSGTYVNLTTTDSGDGIRAVAAGLTNDAATTDRSSEPISNPGGGSFVAGEQSTDGVVDDHQLTSGDFTEHVYGIEIVDANVANNDTFDFQLSGNIDNNNVTPPPRITVSKTSVELDVPVGKGSLTTLGRQTAVENNPSVGKGSSKVFGRQVATETEYKVNVGKGGLTTLGRQPVAENNPSVGKGSLTVFGRQPAVENNPSVGKGSLTVFGRQLKVENNVVVGKGSLSIVGYKPAAQRDPTVFRPGFRIVRISRPLYSGGTYRTNWYVQYIKIPIAPEGDPPPAADEQTVSVGKGSLTVNGRQLTEQKTLAIGKGSLTINGRQTAVENDVSLGKGEVTLLGRQVTPETEQTLTIGKGSLTISGRQLSVENNPSLGKGSVNILGRQLSVENDVSLGKGNVVINGRLLTTSGEKTLPVGRGLLSVSGNSITLTITLAAEEEQPSNLGGGGAYEHFERIAREDEMILAVIQEFLDKAA